MGAAQLLPHGLNYAKKDSTNSQEHCFYMYLTTRHCTLIWHKFESHFFKIPIPVLQGRDTSLHLHPLRAS